MSSKETALTAKKVIEFIWTHPANQEHRTRAVLRALAYQTRAKFLHRRTLAKLGDSSRIWVDPDRRAASKVVYANPPDYHEMNVWRRALHMGDLFLDVGANIGTYTIWASELGATVIALEPAKDTFSLLQENIALNGYAAIAIQAAAGSTCGKAQFTSGLDCANRLDERGINECDMLALDSIIKDQVVAGMKVDVEGFEIEVLRGCRQALAERRIKLMQLEWNSTSSEFLGIDRKPIVDLLAEHGYRLYRPDSQGRLAPIKDTGFGPDVFAKPCEFGV